ncbi:MAG: putative tryptophan/tyrosine transport system ATP-binding protein [Clostridia bacterium]|jgi:putative ABC transport system ATP-binding protein|nr:putative tryptophan/tyrosine transport system ATP-binding protein [Clostridia bacterium]MDN5375939.1 putative tryptophan/tyrosine transport system ATP-binding protein [Thermacetogenium sp.]
MLRVENICKTFNKGSINEKVAIDNLSLFLDEGEFVTVIGGNGAGKSTLINCIAGVYEIDSGRIFLDGMDITYTPEYKRSQYIGRVFQDPLLGTAFDMTIEENLAIAYAKGKPKNLKAGITKADRALFREKLALLELGLEDRLKEKVSCLSGGQRQALTLLMATIVKPKLLLLDEHTAALDPATAKKVLQLTDEIVKKEKLCTIMITHNIKAALEYGTRTIMMHEGKIIMDLNSKDKEKVTVEWLIEQFNRKIGTEFDNDRMLLG